MQTARKVEEDEMYIKGWDLQRCHHSSHECDWKISRVSYREEIEDFILIVPEETFLHFRAIEVSSSQKKRKKWRTPVIQPKLKNELLWSLLDVLFLLTALPTFMFNLVHGPYFIPRAGCLEAKDPVWFTAFAYIQVSIVHGTSQLLWNKWSWEMRAKSMLNCFALVLVRKILGLGSHWCGSQFHSPCAMPQPRSGCHSEEWLRSLFRQPMWKSELGMTSRKTDVRRPDPK